ncbi:2'-5' RNA ligase [Trichococcus patagoniensis]|uniref:RNA 2',3'-cyclic phosphodiesterase n=1 Tax=Trichococcus patagoniensis TaxID=382641 RepID=A0A2T5IMH5_9LACT|nr:RNA 2',3'-cyclic phosphodiesterase [Trichococcus patagoniensis]PTQ85036.1 2'-5' RNA ligase [Trichococcus patagoniensis]
MRVFIGVRLPDVIKEQLGAVQEEVKRASLKGSFTDPDNFHLTIRFIGEVNPEQKGAIEAALICCTADQVPFLVETDGWGYFLKKNKWIIWLGIKENGQLHQLYDQLNAELLVQATTVADEVAFIPHLTLGRGIVLSQEWETLSKVPLPSEQKIPVTALTLFESVRVNGKLVYRPIADFPFNGQTIQSASSKPTNP